VNPAEQREEAIFEAALKLSADQRETYLDQTCAGNAELRRRVEALLGAFQRAGGFLNEPAVPMATIASPPTEKAGDRIGRYKLLQQIGEGGCGVVYMAEQEEPVRRRVALKVIKLGMDTKQVVARFEAERQALAMMDHPNIAKVLDAGATDTGRPYFVMELVRGIKITEFCDENKMSAQERVQFLIQVCHAIQHAHQKGIIHRDIKPSNILVTVNDGVPVPKVIDFGIAKATQGRLTDKTLFTAFEQFIGTPAYMSPEQAVMTSLDVDTRSDIYSLGVLLYELLTGTTPFDAKELLSRGLDEMRRTIREVEPVKPSTRLSTMLEGELATTALHRHTDAPKLIHLLRGDLDWIVMKCLEKDRSRRYETANGLASDLNRHLNNEPIVARPPSKLYHFQKTVKRNRLAFMAAVAVATALVLGVIGTTIGFVRSERQRRLAVAAQRLAQENFDQARAGVADLLAVSDEDLYDQPGMQPLRAKMMRAAIARYKPFLDRPSADPAPRAELARLYVKYGFFNFVNGEDNKKEALPAIESGLAIQQQLLREHPGNLAVLSDLGWTYVFHAWASVIAGKSWESNTNSLAIFEALARGSPNDPLARADLAWAIWQGSWYSTGTQSFSLSERALAIREQLVKEFPRSAEFRRDLANSLQGQGRSLARDDPAAAIVPVMRSIELRAALIPELGQRTPEIFQPLRTLSSEARILRTAVHWTKRDLAVGYMQAAHLRGLLGQPAEALTFADRALDIYRPLMEQNPSIARFTVELAEALLYGAQLAQQTGDANGARDRRTQSLGFLRAQFPIADPERLAAPLRWDYGQIVAASLTDLTLQLLGAGNFAEAEPFARHNLSVREAKLPDDWQTSNARSLLGASLLGQKKYAEAEPLLVAGYDGLKARANQIPASARNSLREALQRLVQLDESTDRPDRASEWKQKLAQLDQPAK
jgi:serine/threonine protein kinase